VVVLQPSYLPWLGYFDQMARADKFVFYDDVQYDKDGWRNRNRIKTAQGPSWLTVPVLTTGRFAQTISEVLIDPNQPWPRKHIRALREAYARARYTNDYLPDLEALLSSAPPNLADLTVSICRMMARWLGIGCATYQSSAMAATPSSGGDRNGRLIAICQELGATHYLSGAAARSYLDVDAFLRENIEVEWQDYVHPAYGQQFGPFMPYLSTIDLIFNEGHLSLDIILNTLTNHGHAV